MTLAGIAAAYLLTVWHVDRQLATRSYEGVYKSCFKVWATRGLVTGRRPDDSKAGNSIASVRRAFAAGAEGTEIDVYYDVALGQFVVSHDRPYNTQEDGGLLYLEDLFEATAGDRYFWLDLKKLGKLTRAEAQKAAKRLRAIARTDGLFSRIYVEGEDPVNLSQFNRIGFKTILDSQPLPDAYPLARFVLNIYKLGFYFGDFTVMAMNASKSGKPIYGRIARRVLRHVPVFIYHVPEDPVVLDSLLTDERVRVIIMGDHSINKYSSDACSA